MKSPMKGGRPASRLHSLSIIAFFALAIAAVTVLGHYMYGDSDAAGVVSVSQGKAKLYSFKDHKMGTISPPTAQYNHEEIQQIRSRGEALPRPPEDGTPSPPVDGRASDGDGNDGNDQVDGSEGDDGERAPVIRGERDLPTLLHYGKERAVQFTAPAFAPDDAVQADSAEETGSNAERAGGRNVSYEEYLALRKAMLSARGAVAAPSTLKQVRHTDTEADLATWRQQPQPLSNKYASFLATHFSSRGRYVPYHNQYGALKTNGTVFVYERNDSRVNESCMISKVSFKYHPVCSHEPPGEVLSLLVLGIQRSGTHVIVGALKELGIDIRHEGVGVDGGCGWPFVSNIYSDPMTIKHSANKRYILNNRNRQLRQRYRVVLHQVRHPLAVIRTLLVRAPKWDRFWEWISKQYYCSNIHVHLDPPTRAMMLYLCWNEHIERQADRRYQIETTHVRDVCTWAGYPAERCNAVLGYNATVPVRAIANATIAAANQASVSKLKKKVYKDANWPEYFYNTTWEMLEEANYELTIRVKNKCVEYNYPIDL